MYGWLLQGSEEEEPREELSRRRLGLRLVEGRPGGSLRDVACSVFPRKKMSVKDYFVLGGGGAGWCGPRLGLWRESFGITTQPGELGWPSGGIRGGRIA